MELFERIKKEVEAEGVQHLANALGVWPASIYKWMQRETPSKTNLKKLAKYFGGRLIINIE